MALPLALKCSWVVGVESFPSTGKVFREQAKLHNVSNVTLVDNKWEEAKIKAADVVICFHVLYTIKEAGLFIRNMEQHAKEWIWVAIFDLPPQYYEHRLWEQIHGVKRLNLPAFAELKGIFGELRILAKIEEFPVVHRGTFSDFGGAWRSMLRALFFGRKEAARMVS